MPLVSKTSTKYTPAAHSETSKQTSEVPSAETDLTSCPKALCIICVVGDLDWSNLGFETLATEAMKDIPVRMISYGGSNYNISFLIKEQDKKRALQNLSDNLFSKK